MFTHTQQRKIKFLHRGFCRPHKCPILDGVCQHAAQTAQFLAIGNISEASKHLKDVPVVRDFLNQDKVWALWPWPQFLCWMPLACTDSWHYLQHGSNCSMHCCSLYCSALTDPLQPVSLHFTKCTTCIIFQIMGLCQRTCIGMYIANSVTDKYDLTK